MPLRIVRNNIVQVEADAIVNTANPYPVIGSGVDSCIYEAAGARELLTARRQIGEIPPGQAALTPAFGLRAKYIIHAVTPRWTGGHRQERMLLRSTYEQILELAVAHQCQSVAMPLLGTGNNRFPKGLSLALAREVSEKYLQQQEDLTVLLVVYDKESFKLAAESYDFIESYLEENFPTDPPSYRSYMRLENRMEDVAGEEMLSEYCEALPRSAKLDDEIDADKVPPLASYHVASTKLFSKQSNTWPEFELPPKLESFSDRLFQLIDKKGLEEVVVYKKANMDRKHFSKLRKRDYTPKKPTVLALALALRLNVDETMDLLSYAGLALAPNDKQDMIVKLCIENSIFDVLRVNEILFTYDVPTLN
ncbi:MAG: macro domain-containing protein [Phascolarctobacterium sp.]